MRLRKWVICVECNRKYKANGDTNYPTRHYVPPTRIILGEIAYMTNPGWEGKEREVCKGTYKKGKEI